MRWIEILWRLEGQRDVFAWFDWASGIVRIETTKPEFDGALARLQPGVSVSAGDPDAQFVRAVTHEHVHLLQALTTGYLYRWGVELADILRDMVRDLVADAADETTLVDELRNAARRIDPKAMDRYRAHLDKPDRPGPYGLTTRCIFEAHALFLELLTHYAPTDEWEMVRLLAEAEAPGSDRVAFDLVRLWLPGDAFRMFPALAIAALCTSDPPTYFVRLVQSEAWSAGVSEPLEAVEIIALINEQAGPELIGTAAEEFERSPQAFHPILTPTLKELIGADFQFGDLLVDPLRALNAVGAKIIQPTLFRSDEEGRFSVVVPKGSSEQRAEDALLLAAASAALQPSAGSAARFHDTTKKVEWLTKRDGHLRVLNAVEPIEGSAKNLSSLDAGEWTAGLWGSCVVAFDLPDEAIAPREPMVQEFVAGVAAKLPAFPLFLDLRRDLGMAWLWFGAQASQDAWESDLGLNLNHPSVVAAVNTALAAMSSRARELGLDASPQIDQLKSATDSKR
jgi:hypothetical protein